MTQDALVSLRGKIEQHFSVRPYFACVYGSFAYGEERKNSDLDLFIAAESPTDLDRDSLREIVVDVHRQYGLTLDAEVPYENKLVVSFQDLDCMAALDAFPVQQGKRMVPRIQKTKSFLGSQEVRWRLLLNALTTPHLFLCGDKKLYNFHRHAAEGALRKLAQDLSPHDPISGLLQGPQGESGEEYLGYKFDRSQVIAYLGQILADASITS